MLMQPVRRAATQSRRDPTLHRPALKPELRRHNGDKRSEPVGDGVAVKRSEMRIRVSARIQYQPAQQNAANDQTQSVTTQPCAMTHARVYPLATTGRRVI